MMKLLIFLYKQKLLSFNYKHEIITNNSAKSTYYGQGMYLRKEYCACNERH